MNTMIPRSSRPVDSHVLWREYKTDGDAAARAHLIERYTHLARHVVDRLGLHPCGWLSTEDLLSHALIGLMDAIEKFDLDRGVRFETYAVTRIRGAVLDMLRALDWVPREMRRRENELKAAAIALEHRLGRPAEDREMMEALGWTAEEYQEALGSSVQGAMLSLDSYLTDGGDEALDPLECLGYDDGNPMRHAQRQERRRLLVEAIETLNDQERTVMALYYFEDLTLREIGAVLEVSESRVCQIHTKAIWRLQGKLARYEEALSRLD